MWSLIIVLTVSNTITVVSGFANKEDCLKASLQVADSFVDPYLKNDTVVTRCIEVPLHVTKREGTK